MTPVQTALVAGTALMFVLLMGVVTISAQRIEGQRKLDTLQTQLSDLQNTNREQQLPCDPPSSAAGSIHPAAFLA